MAPDKPGKAPWCNRRIKAAIDRQRWPGRFLLTGSANVMLLPRLSECISKLPVTWLPRRILQSSVRACGRTDIHRSFFVAAQLSLGKRP